MEITATTLDGYHLLHEGTLALADVEQNGICIDIEYCKRQQKHIERRIKHTEQKLLTLDEVKLWKKQYPGTAFNLESGEQLGNILFNHLGYEAKVLTKTGKPAVSEEALEQVDSPLVEDILLLKRLQKVRSTYLENFIKETVAGVLHPFFHLHTVITYRSSSSAINFQNIPNRIAWIKKICRQAIKPRPGHMIGEIDYSGAEVRISACYHHDPAMIRYINDPTTDMHRDVAMDCYLLSPEELGHAGTSSYKQPRQAAKNKFVFPQFYGDYYGNCAQGLWDDMNLLKMETAQGILLKKHLASKKIRDLEAFTRHLKKVEDHFWNKRFKVYNAWKKKQVEHYTECGYVELLTGFRCSGLMNRKDVTNYPVQGAAFHCLLWCLIQMNRIFREQGWKTQIIGQIHDSMVLDIYPPELNRVVRLAKYLMEVKIRKVWPWVIVPLEIEMEASPVDGSWYLKKEIHPRPEKCVCGALHGYKNYIGEAREIFWSCPVCGQGLK